MKISQPNNFFLNNPSFGAKLPTDEVLKTIQKITDCQTNNLVSGVTEAIGEKHLRDVGGVLIPKVASKGAEFLGAIKDLIHMPRGLATSFVQKFKGETGFLKSLYDNENGFVQRHLKDTELKRNLGTLQGVYEIGAETLGKVKKGGENCLCGQNDSNCGALSDKLHKLLNQAMAWGKPNYATNNERFQTRLITALIAAGFMGKDFTNKALMQGKSNEEAKKSSKVKLNQEVISGIGEACTQFVLISMFAKQANTNAWVAALFSTGVGFSFNIISRLMTGMKLSRVNVGENHGQKVVQKPIGIESFIESVKTGKSLQVEKTIVNSQEVEPTKKPLLSIKNILIASGISILGGFALAALKKKTIDTSFIGEKIAKIEAGFIGDVDTNKNELDALNKVLGAISEDKLRYKISKAMNEILEPVSEDLKETHKIKLGTELKKTKKFFGLEVPVKNLYGVLLAPVKFTKDVVSFPYDKAKKLVDAIQKLKAKEGGKAVENFGIEDIKNIVLRFREFKEIEQKALADGKTYDLVNEFGKYVKEMRKVSLNKITSSKVDNASIGIIAQVLGTLSGIGFNMNDDFNKTIENGGTKKEAEKDARKRGINKFIRVSIQGVIAHQILNTTFAKQYNGSLLGAGIITAIATILTDKASRKLTGMPSSIMTKEEQVAHKEKQEKSLAGGYYKLVDKLAE